MCQSGKSWDFFLGSVRLKVINPLISLGGGQDYSALFSPAKCLLWHTWLLGVFFFFLLSARKAKGSRLLEVASADPWTQVSSPDWSVVSSLGKVATSSFLQHVPSCRLDLVHLAFRGAEKGHFAQQPLFVYACRVNLFKVDIQYLTPSELTHALAAAFAFVDDAPDNQRFASSSNPDAIFL